MVYKCGLTPSLSLVVLPCFNCYNFRSLPHMRREFSEDRENEDLKLELIRKKEQKIQRLQEQVRGGVSLTHLRRSGLLALS